jgi:hypothetical protein
VTYLRFDPSFSWAAQSAARWLDVHLEGHVEPVGSGSRLVLRTHLQPRGPLRPLAPVLRRYMHRVWNRNLAAIKDRLERPEGYPRPGGDHQEAAPPQP